MKSAKYSVMLVITAVAIIFTLNSCADNPISGFAPYKNEIMGFSLDLPENWDKLENYMGLSIASLSRSEGVDDNYRENINVFFEQLTVSSTLEQYYQSNVARMSNLLVEFKEIENGDTKIGDRDSKWLIYSSKMGQTDILTLSYIMIKGKYGLSINCSAEKSKFDDYRKDYEKVGHSFKFELSKVQIPVGDDKTDK